MDKLVPAFKESVFDAHLSDVLGETVEFGIDSVLDEGILKDIPFVSTIIGIAKTAQNIYDRNLLRQTAAFIQTFNVGSISPKKIEKYRAKIDSDPQFAEQELSRILVLLNGNIDLEKSRILAKFYRAYVEEKINWEQFCELSEILHRIFISDICLLDDIYNGEILKQADYPQYRVERLIALGLINHKKIGFSFGNQNITSNPAQNEIGRLFYQLYK